jgi:hypothetical protein
VVRREGMIKSGVAKLLSTHRLKIFGTRDLCRYAKVSGKR